MTDNDYTFDQARARLEEIVTQVRKQDVSLEKSLDLLEEGVRLANVCTELSDHTEWRTVAEEAGGESVELVVSVEEENTESVGTGITDDSRDEDDEGDDGVDGESDEVESSESDVSGQ
ncbi:MAG: exodeoxyribonuclease VII small subunit [Actinomycetota bacterium]|jgi:exodeoxyribonuclease VII small subunit|nr:exodeoxyribonuclease VII small subunit [Actinomycetota bacterium]